MDSLRGQVGLNGGRVGLRGRNIHFTTYSPGSNELLEFVLLYSIAGYIRLYGKSIKLQSRHFFVLWVIATAVTFLSGIAFIILSREIAFFAENTLLFYERCSLPTLLRAVFFFMIFERMKLPYNKYINMISSAAFGVYLIHDSNIIRPWLWKTVFVNSRYQNSRFIIPYSLAAVLIVYVVCTAIDLIRSHTIEPVYMRAVNRYADRLLHSIKKLFQRFG